MEITPNWIFPNNLVVMFVRIWQKTVPATSTAALRIVSMMISPIGPPAQNPAALDHNAVLAQQLNPHAVVKHVLMTTNADHATRNVALSTARLEIGTVGPSALYRAMEVSVQELGLLPSRNAEGRRVLTIPRPRIATMRHAVCLAWWTASLLGLLARNNAKKALAIVLGADKLLAYLWQAVSSQVMLGLGRSMPQSIPTLPRLPMTFLEMRALIVTIRQCSQPRPSVNPWGPNVLDFGGTMAHPPVLALRALWTQPPM
jgi:hypothetical protein